MTVIRTFIVWLLLLALPYQGYAAAAMMLCAPVAVAPAAAVATAGAHAAMAVGAHDHAAMMAAMRGHSQAGAQAASPDVSPDGSSDSSPTASMLSGHADHAHGGVKCGGAACCIAGAPTMAHAIAVPALPAVSSAVPFYSEFLHAVDLAHPERPPQVNFV